MTRGLSRSAGTGVYPDQNILPSCAGAPHPDGIVDAWAAWSFPEGHDSFYEQGASARLRATAVPADRSPERPACRPSGSGTGRFRSPDLPGQDESTRQVEVARPHPGARRRRRRRPGHGALLGTAPAHPEPKPAAPRRRRNPVQPRSQGIAAPLRVASRPGAARPSAPRVRLTHVGPSQASGTTKPYSPTWWPPGITCSAVRRGPLRRLRPDLAPGADAGAWRSRSP